MVTYITDDGFCAFSPIGGHDPQILPGARVRVHTSEGALLGVLGRMPIHLLEEDERKQVVKMHKMFIDLGLARRRGQEACAYRRSGHLRRRLRGVRQEHGRLPRVRRQDGRVGLCGSRCARWRGSGGARGDLIAAATVQEEIGLRGGITSAYGVDPVVGIAVEVGHATDYPDVDKRKHGEAKVGGGPIITRGANINPKVFELLVAAAKAEDIPFQTDGQPRGTGTDANAIQLCPRRQGRSAGERAAALHAHSHRDAVARRS